MTTLEPISMPAGKLRKAKQPRLTAFACAKHYQVRYWRGGSRLYCCVTNHGKWSGRKEVGKAAHWTDGLPPGEDQWYRVKTRSN